MADALQQGCDWIITCGGPQSNHTRATAVMARQLGLDVSIVTMTRPGFDASKAATGNLLLNEIFASKIIWVSFENFQKKGSSYDFFLNEELERLRSLGKKPYVIPLGGSNVIGCLGYLNAVEEMSQTWKKSVSSTPPDSLFCALGSAGTYVGLQLGLHTYGLNQTQLYGVNVLGAKETAEAYVSRLQENAAQHFNFSFSSSNASQIDGYAGEGYALATDSDLEFYIRLAREDGILLDPCYTGKAFQGMISEIKKDPKRFGERILFLHSGGGFGSFAYAEQFQSVMKKNQT